MRWTASVVFVLLAIAVLVGCGGGGDQMAATPSPGSPDSPEATVTEEVGPFVIQTAAAANLQMQSIPSETGAAFTAVHGAQLNYVAVQEMLDRIVYRRIGGGLYVSDLFGDNRHLISNDDDFDPNWSPGGNLIVCSSGFGNSAELILMDADGSNRRQVTNDSTGDYDPAFSPNGFALAFYRDDGTDMDIFRTNLEGDELTNLTNTTSDDARPEWTPDGDIVYSAEDRTRLTRMEDDGSGKTYLTDPSGTAKDKRPHMSPDGDMLIFEREDGSDDDIHVADADGDHIRQLTADGSDEKAPCFSTDGRFLAYQHGSGPHIYVMDNSPQHHRYPVITGVSAYTPDLGSPTLQTSRVLIGPSGADRTFDPPITPSVAYGAVVAFDSDGYLNFVRIGIYGHHADDLEVTPKNDAGDQVVALEVTAPQLINIVQDAGAGEDADKWNLAGTTTAALLMFDAQTGKLSSVLALEDQSLTAEAGTDGGPTFRPTGTGTTVTGSFSAVYDATGEIVAEGSIDSVEVDVEAGTTRAL